MPKKKKKKIIDSKRRPVSFKPPLRDIIVIILGGIILAIVFNPSMFTGGDNAQYITLAKSILKGEYRNVAFIGNPTEIEIPPGYPLLITPLIGLFPDTFIPTKLLSFISMLLGIWVCLKLFDKHKIPKIAGAIIALAFFLNPAFNEFSHWTLTESPYFALSLFGLWIFDKNWETENVWKFTITCVVLIVTMYIRPVAAPLLLGAFVFLLLKKRFAKAALFIFTGVIIYGPWLIRNILVRKGDEESFYLINFFGGNATGSAKSVGLFERFFANMGKYIFRELPTTFTAVQGETGIVPSIVGLITVLLIGVGLYRLIIRKNSFIPYYIIIYSSMLMLYNPRFATFRYLVQLLPLLMIAIWECLSIEKPIRIKPWRKQILIIFSIIMLVIAFFRYIPVAKNNLIILQEYSRGNKYAGVQNPGWLRFIEACDWIKENTDENAGLISRKPRISFILSDRPGKVYVFSQSPRTVLEDIDSSGAEYIIVDKLIATTQAYLIPTIQAYPERFALVHKTPPPETYVFKLLPPGSAPQQTNQHTEQESQVEDKGDL